MLSFILAVAALVIAVMNGSGRVKQVPPLWVAVALLAIAMMIPWLLSMSIR